MRMKEDLKDGGKTIENKGWIGTPIDLTKSYFCV